MGLPAHEFVFIFFTILWGIFRSSVFNSFGNAVFIFRKLSSSFLHSLTWGEINLHLQAKITNFKSSWKPTGSPYFGLFLLVDKSYFKTFHEAMIIITFGVFCVMSELFGYNVVWLNQSYSELGLWQKKTVFSIAQKPHNLIFHPI